MKLLHFMEERWNFKFANREQMEELLHISFVNDGRDIPSELDEEDDTEITVASDNDLKLQFWTNALPVIVDAFGGNSTYSNVSPAPRSTLDGFVGIGGVNLYCTMRLKKHTLSANIWIDVKDKEKNKKIFDVMYARKDNIEKQVPCSIDWNRGDDRRSSTVNVEIEDVDFNDTSRWPELIKFLATTCVALKTELITACDHELRAVIDGN